MSPQNSDSVLDVLLEVRATASPELDDLLLRECYAIQKKYQFDRDREIPLDATRRLVERFVGEELRAGDQGR
jgi:hypothetical protein